MAGSIIYLPNELLEYILESEVLSYRDVHNFGSTCVKFRSLITNSNSLWKIKFHQRWPGLQNVFNRHQEYDWQEQFRNCLALSTTVRQYVSQMSRKFYKKDEISNCELSEFEKMMKGHKFAYSFMISELMTICCDGNITANLTQKFYAEKVIRYLRQLHLKEKWCDYLKLSPEDQTLEKGAVLVAQWCQPMADVSYESIASRLDGIANRVKFALQHKHPNHPIFKTPPEKLEFWRNKNIEGNQFNPTESELIIRALQKVLFIQIGFHGNNEMYYSAENSYINKVLDDCRGIPITLSIVFESIARRLGVRCEPVSFPAHFLLRWKQNYNPDGEPSPYYYIDVFNGGQFLTKQSCPRYNSDGVCPMKGLSMSPATPVQVIERMANNLEVAGRQRTHMNGRGARLRSALELLNLVNPSDMNCILHLARFYMLYNMDLTELIATITNMQTDLNERGRDQASHIMQMLQVYETHHNTSTTPPESWGDMRRAAKQKAVATKIVINKTGGGPPIDPEDKVDPLQGRIVGIIGEVLINGDPHGEQETGYPTDDNDLDESIVVPFDSPEAGSSKTIDDHADEPMPPSNTKQGTRGSNLKNTIKAAEDFSANQKKSLAFQERTAIATEASLEEMKKQTEELKKQTAAMEAFVQSYKTVHNL